MTAHEEVTGQPHGEVAHGPSRVFHGQLMSFDSPRLSSQLSPLPFTLHLFPLPSPLGPPLTPSPLPSSLPPAPALTMVLTLAPFSGVNVTSKIALWEMVCAIFVRLHAHSLRTYTHSLTLL